MKNNTTMRLVLISLLVIIGIYLIADHGQHFAPYLPFAFLLGCLFMHLFMHGSHGGHSGHGGGDGDTSRDRQEHNQHKM